MKRHFVETENVARFMEGLVALEKRGAEECSLMVVDGAPGLGKTTALEWWAAQNSIVFLRALKEWSPQWFLADLLAKLRITPAHSFQKRYHQALEALTLRQDIADTAMDAGPYQFINSQFEQLFEWMKKAGGEDGIDGFAKKIGTGIVEVMRGAVEIAKTFSTAIATIGPILTPVVDAFGGWKNVITAILALQLVGWVQALLAPLSLLIPSLTINTAAMRAFAVSAAGSVASALATAATAAWGFAAALAANPITWIVAGLVALAAAAYLVYQNWDKIGPMLSAAWESIKSGAENAWKGVKDAATDAWNGLSDAVGNGLKAATAKIGEWGDSALSAMQSAFGKVKGWFDTAVGGLGKAWDGVKNAAAGALSYVGLGKDATPEEKQAAERQRAIADGGKASDAIALLNQLQQLLPTVAAAASSFDLAAPINAAIAAARASIASQSFYSEGVALMSTLAVGIEAGAAKAVAAVRNVAQQMRDHLPHSPAKVGPLSDLDQVRFSETLAAAIRPDPAVAAVRNVAAGMAAAIGDGPQIGVRAGGGSGAGASGGGGGGPVTIHFAPVIHGAGGEARGIVEQLRPYAYELAELVRRELRQNDRLAYREV